VAHAVERHQPGLADFEHRKIPVHCEIGDDHSPYVHGFEPNGTHREIEVPKRRYSVFYATDLDLLLREQGVRTLVTPGRGITRGRGSAASRTPRVAWPPPGTRCTR
jgi:maleamate amidohydrolase